MSASSITPIRNVISVDVEDYFQVEAFSNVVRRDQWGEFPTRVRENTRRLMDLFEAQGVKGTFFVLGWVANKYPQLVREIVRRGHEPACHSYWHRLVYSLTPAEFRRDTALAKDAIEQAAGQRIWGYRAPCFSLTARTPWAAEILTELGFRYDSSIFPIKHEWYGIAEAPRRPFQIATPAGFLTEYPIATFRYSKTPNMPVGGGGYLRLMPSWYTRVGIKRAWSEGLGVVAYIHPWEVDPEQPRLAASLKSRFRHYTNLGKTSERLAGVLRMGGFQPFAALEPLTDAPVWHFPMASPQHVAPAVPEFDAARA